MNAEQVATLPHLLPNNPSSPAPQYSIHPCITYSINHTCLQSQTPQHNYHKQLYNVTHVKVAAHVVKATVCG